ncbi:MAG TPA: hypothetical protein VH743_00975 [Beijerinckiaceae bacterium]|jgi:hypothetical protein
MPRYRVTFFKTVCGDTGRETSVCQRAVEVDAENADAAIEPARALFCKLEQIPHWSVRSDACATEEMRMPRAPLAKRMGAALHSRQ